MMPNSNNLALSLVSGKGKTLTKNSAKNSIKNDDFLKAFGKNKKDEKEKTVTNNFGFMVQPLKINANVPNEKNVNNKLSIEKTTDKVVKNSSKNETFNVSLSKKTENKAVEVLGNRIESTKSANLKLENNVGTKEIKETSKMIMPLETKEVLSNATKEVKNPTNTQVLKGKNVESPLEKSVKTEKTANNTLNNKEVNFAGSPNTEIQNKGRISGTINKGNPLQGKEFQANENSNFVKTETKKLEPAQEMISGYGLKKINNQIKLEEKVENAKELMSLEKGLAKEKIYEKANEKVEIGSISSLSKDITFETKESPILSKTNANVDYSAIVQQVENGLKINYNNQLKEMKIKLQPEELGEVEVKMTIENNIMKAEFVVESQVVKEILESKFDTLKSALENKGFNGAEINVSVSTGNDKKSQSFFATNEEMKKDVKDSVDYVSKIENLDSNSKITKTSKSSGIDIMV